LSRPRPIPKKVREAIRLIVYGRLDDPDCKPLDFIAAAKIVGLQPDQMRRHLDRADVRALLLAERRAFRAAICGSNELALRRVRDKSANGMATVAAVRALEQIDEADPSGGPTAQRPGVTIIIGAPAPALQPPTIDVRPVVTIEHQGPHRDEHGEPVFDPRPFPHD
jgi:hypothetical protein